MTTRTIPKAVSIVMPTYNGMGTIEKSVESIFSRTTFSDFDLIIIDNGSTDETEDWIHEYKKTAPRHIRYVKLNKNYGTCYALNRGFEIAQPNDAIRIDNNVVISSDDWIEKFRETAYSVKKFGLVHGYPAFPAEDRDSIEIRIITEGLTPSPPPVFNSDDSISVVELQATWITCAYIKNYLLSWLYNDINYDPGWLEDIDYCMQVRRSELKVVSTPKVVISHIGGRKGRNSPKTEEREKNLDYFQRKWWKLGEVEYIKRVFFSVPNISDFVGPIPFTNNRTNLPKREIVVARYKENLNWIDQIPAESVTVYNKGPVRCNYEDRILPNWGRETSTYLFHIIENWNSLTDQTLFLQGNPLEHSPDMIKLLSQYYDCTQPFNWRFMEQPAGDFNRQFPTDGLPPRTFREKFTTELTDGARVYVEWIDQNGRAVYPGYYYDPDWEITYFSSVRKIWRIPDRESLYSFVWKKLGASDPLPILIPFCHAAQFSVPRHVIKQRSLDFYKNCLTLCASDPYWPFIFERLWLIIFFYHHQVRPPKVTDKLSKYLESVKND
jgi:glycosyltransferase involved in cell wall biosynthesis